MNLKRFLTIIAKQLNFGNADEITMDMTFSDDLVLDDDEYYELLEILEEEFNVDLIEYDGEFDSLAELAHIIRQG